MLRLSLSCSCFLFAVFSCRSSQPFPQFACVTGPVTTFPALNARVCRPLGIFSCLFARSPGHHACLVCATRCRGFSPVALHISLCCRSAFILRGVPDGSTFLVSHCDVPSSSLSVCLSIIFVYFDGRAHGPDLVEPCTALLFAAYDPPTGGLRARAGQFI